MLYGTPVYIATTRIQRRKHHKKRINKKWAKRYGYIEYNSMPYGQVVLLDGVLYMTQKTFDFLQLQIDKGTI